MRASLRRPAALLTALLVALPLSACGVFGSETGPEQAAQQFLAAFAGGDSATASQQTDSPESARALMDKVRTALKPSTVIARVDKVDTGQGTARAAFEITWDLGRNRRWTYDSSFDLIGGDDAWKVRWAPTVLHPELGAQQSLAVEDSEATLAPVLDRDGTPVLNPERVVSVLFDQAEAGDANAIAGQLAQALSGIDPTITAQSILDGAKAAGAGGYQVVALRDADYQKVKSLIYDLPGVRFPAESRLLPADRALAPTLMPAVRKVIEDQVQGKAGWRVYTVDSAGNESQVLHDKPAEPAKAVSLALSTRVQQAAQAAIAGEATPSMLVAIQPSTGDLLAVAQNAPADAAGQLALTGRYPPGSTFKIVTAAQAIAAGTVTGETPLGCPPAIVVNGREIPNSGRFDKGVVPLRSAFAFSCNTTFADLATRMGAGDLTAMAKKLGLGLDYVVPGITTITGSVPAASDVNERAEDGFGQGKVVASPFGMAVVTATVASGSVPKPVLVRGAETQVDEQQEPLPAAVLEQVRGMMREVVAGGTAGALAPYGDVRGKTGTAQFGDGTRSHGWFVGYRGDLAFAVLLTDVGQSGTAVAATGRFLAAVG
ncbi:penicillin-binding transpeptidase domain-containing protein [Actinokineospora spheciospongiae]|uniref:penicillin-binding transpeptidase domain-containing protein n=1 Tax=Actinokineospora spheciospongiae TaxID=909613 RepID=UPI00055943FC|nr:penicillin-binding transpeptidase domain-containing protein [Actinokineospora spheciospongiae]